MYRQDFSISTIVFDIPNGCGGRAELNHEGQHSDKSK